jgi:hypothetical protein
MMNRFTANLILIALVLSEVFMLVGCAGNCKKAAKARPTLLAEQTAKADKPDSKLQENMLRENWGIKVESTRLSAGGYMVDFRYRVLDADKAAPILDRKVKPYLVDQASGATFIVPNPPKVGQLRSGKNIKEDKIYFIFFANPGRYIKSGNKVTVAIGDCKIQNLTVQ